jgi:DNA-binding PadR family transcriptional regulator
MRGHATRTYQFILLGLIRPAPRYGYELYKQLAEEAGIGLVWRAGRSNLYALLAKMETDGLVSATEEPGEGKAPRVRYAITPQGERAFLEWLRVPVERGRDMRQDFLARLFFALQDGTETALALIDRQLEVSTRRLESARDLSSTLGPSDLFERLALDFRVEQTESELRWLADSRNAILTAQNVRHD